MKKLILSLKDYLEYYKSSLAEFLREHDDHREIDFINRELIYWRRTLESCTDEKVITQSEEMFIMNGTNKTINELRSMRRATYRRIIEYLNQKNKTKVEETNIVVKPVEVELDPLVLKGTEKIIYLEKLGILDFLNEKAPFNTSTNALANVISAITGIKQTSVYPMINPILKDNVDQKNNPLLTENTVRKVQLKLDQIGFKIS